MSELFLDIETNGTDGHTGDLLLVGYALDDGPVNVLGPDEFSEPEYIDQLLAYLASPSIRKVSHSIFDPRFLSRAKQDVQGPIIDTKVMPWVLNENTPLDIDWLAFRYAGIDMDKRLVRSGGHVYFKDDDGQLYDLADWREWHGTEVWRRFEDYCGRDVDALRKLYYEVKERLDEAQWTRYWEQEEVPYTRVLLDMELRGMPVDLERTAVLEAEMREVKDVTQAELLAEAGLPPEFNLNSQPQLVAYLFSRVTQLTGTLRLGADAVACIKSCIDGEHEDCEMDPPDHGPGTYDLVYTPLHMVDLLPENFTIDKVGRDIIHGHYTVRGRGLRPTPKTLNKVTGEEGKLPSTSSPELLYAHASDPWVLKLCTGYRKAEKLLNTYLRKFPVIAQDDGTGVTRIYGQFNQTGTVTGRLSSSNPNMQNMPSRGERGAAVRRLFRFPDDDPRHLIIADYDQLEMRIMASLSGDPVLCDVFQRGEDPHAMLAEAIFGAVDVRSIPSGAAASYRDAAKNLNYAMGYGAGPKKIAQTLSLLGFPTTKDTAKGYLAEMEDFYRQLFTWIRTTKAEAVRKGSVRTLGGRRRRLRGQFRDTANWKAMGYGERQAVNAIIQGTAADIIRRAMIELADWSLASEYPMLAQVHDELIFECFGVPSQLALSTIQTIGETAHGFNLRVPLIFEPHVGKSWGAKSGPELDELLLADIEEDE